MKTILLLLLPALAASFFSYAQMERVASAVYRWSDGNETEMGAGSRKTILEGNTTALARLTLNAVRLNPGASFEEEAAHRDLEAMIIVKEGALTVGLGDRTYSVGPGSVAVLLPGDSHALSNESDTPVTFYLFRYRSEEDANAARGKEAGGSIVVDWNDVEMRPNDKGGRRQQFDRATAMFERFEMHVTTLNAGLTSHPPHTHDAEEFILIMKGDVEEQIGETLHRASAGDVIFLDSQVLHNIKNVGTGPAEYFAFQWE